jgi:uncharacterized Ntn-hydrolase superfamily protein
VTFSLLATDGEGGGFGAVVSSSSPAVAARCVAVRAGAGVVASQNVTDPRLRGRLLDLLAAGAPAQAAIGEVVASAPHAGYRQLAAVDAMGGTGAYSGPHTLGAHSSAHGRGAVAAGNLLADPSVPERMIDAFATSAGAPLGDRLVAALRAALAAGGEEGQVHSAGLLIAGAVEWPVTDLRVDWSDDPVEELAGLWRLWAPQAESYVQRALDPSAAPAFGVPGDR